MSLPEANIQPVAVVGDATARLISAWHRIALAGVLTLSAVLDLWGLSGNGWANTYYSAAVRSMLGSWSNFFFVSFDPGGLVSVDKPPLALWVEAASAKAFGFSAWSILLPGAIAGVAAVWVLYLLIARVFGKVAGLVAALALAVSPVSVAVNRDNNPDAIFVLLLVVAAYALVRAAERGSFRWLLATAVLVGLAFNTKMLAAFIVLPALTLAYLLFAPLSWTSRVVRLLAAGGVLSIVSSLWIAAVELTPVTSRPYVGSTSDNSALSLALGYNGLGRITGQTGGTSSGGGAGLGGAFSGSPGWLRLVNNALGDQAAWLLPLAIVGGISALVAAVRGRRRAELAALTVVGGWFLTAALVFSFASGIVHTYYLSELAPASCGLVGIGSVALWRDARAGRARALFPAAALALTAWLEVDLLRRSGYLSWLAPVVVAGTVAAVGLLALLAARPLRRQRLLATVALSVGIGTLLLAPTGWSRTTLLAAVNGVFPGAGPSFVSGLGTSTGGGFGAGPGRSAVPGGFGGGAVPPGGFRAQGGLGAPMGTASAGAPPAGAPPAGAFGGGTGGAPPAGGGFSGGTGGSAGGPGGFGQDDGSATQALAYAKANGGASRFALVVSSEQQASNLVIEGEHVASLGGFTGRETVLTPATLSRLVTRNEARYFLLGGGSGPFGSSNAGASLIESVCATVPTTDWRTGTTTSGSSSSAALYDCAGKGAELARSGATAP